MSAIYLVPHPGSERRLAGSGFVDWPQAVGCGGLSHARKFISVSGQWLSTQGLSKGCTYAWAEYEPPTHYTLLPGGRPGWSHGVHTIVHPVQAPKWPTLDTDPWIFWPGFVWACCRRQRIPGGPLVHPRQGDIVLFGSSFGRAKPSWVLDTVMVVQNVKPIGHVAGGSVAYANLVHPAHTNVTDYVEGTSYNSATKAPHSFVPTCAAGRFARPRIDNTFFSRLTTSGGNVPSAGNRQGIAKCSLANAGDSPSAFWQDLVRYVQSCGLEIGIKFRHPVEGGAPCNNVNRCR